MITRWSKFGQQTGKSSILTSGTWSSVADRTAAVLPVHGADTLVAQGVPLVPRTTATAESLGYGLVVVQKVNGIVPGRWTGWRTTVAGSTRRDGVLSRGWCTGRGGHAGGATTGAAARTAGAAVARRARTARGPASPVVVYTAAVVVVQGDGGTPGPGRALAAAAGATAPGRLVRVSGAAVQP